MSDRMVCTMPSSSLRLDVRAAAGVSLAAWYMPRSLLMKRNACAQRGVGALPHPLRAPRGPRPLMDPGART